MAENADEQERYPWAGPALFIGVSILVAVFFWWFVRA